MQTSVTMCCRSNRVPLVHRRRAGPDAVVAASALRRAQPEHQAPPPTSSTRFAATATPKRVNGLIVDAGFARHAIA